MYFDKLHELGKTKMNIVKVRTLIVLVILLSILSNQIIFAGESGETIKVLAVFAKYYGANTFLNLDAMQKLGWEVTTAGLTEDVLACIAFAAPMGCPTLKMDKTLDQVTDLSEYDCFMIMPSSRFIGGYVS